MELTDRELNALLAGLALLYTWMAGTAKTDSNSIYAIATDDYTANALTLDEINELSERINSGGE